MAKEIIKDPVVTVNGVNISDHCSAATISGSAEEVDFTAFSTSAYREFGQGLKDATITLTVFQDYAAASIDATLQPLFENGTSFVVSIKPHNGATSATNPLYEMTAKLYSYDPIAGSIGDASTTELSFRNASSTGLVRKTS